MHPTSFQWSDTRSYIRRSPWHHAYNTEPLPTRQRTTCPWHHDVSFYVVIPVDGTGPIPKELGQLTYLEELDLQWNELDGERETRETPIGSTSHFPEGAIFLIVHRMLKHDRILLKRKIISWTCSSFHDLAITPSLKGSSAYGACSRSVQAVLNNYLALKDCLCKCRIFRWSRTPSPVVNKFCT